MTPSTRSESLDRHRPALLPIWHQPRRDRARRVPNFTSPDVIADVGPRSKFGEGSARNSAFKLTDSGAALRPVDRQDRLMYRRPRVLSLRLCRVEQHGNAARNELDEALGEPGRLGIVWPDGVDPEGNCLPIG